MCKKNENILSIGAFFKFIAFPMVVPHGHWEQNEPKRLLGVTK
jgi:hypothetical protein